MRVGLRELGEVIGVTAIVGSLVFVGLQMQQAQEIALTQNLIASLEVSNQALSEISAHADLWTEANGDRALSPEDELVLENLVQGLNNARLFNWAQAQLLYGGDRGLVQAYDFAAYIRRYPVARKVWEEQELRFRSEVVKHLPADQGRRLGERWVELVRGHLATLDGEE